MGTIIGRGRYARATYPTSPGAAGSAARSSAWYGDGVDGALHFDGVSTVHLAGGLDMVPVGGHYFAPRDIFATTLLVDEGATLENSCDRIFANVSATVNGTVLANPSTGFDFQTLPQGYEGGAGGTSGNPGAAGASMTDQMDPSFNPVGGAGGDGAGGAGGAGGAAQFSPSGGGCLRQAVFSTSGNYVTSGLAGTTQQAVAGAGGGGGGGGGGGSGGAGGIGGGILLLASPIITGTGTLRAKGGAGANAPAAGGGGGGGGGSGGLVLLTSTAPVAGTLILDVSGGAGGAGDGAGVAGNAGGAGAVIQVIA
jgi:hypothetical protein